MRRSGRVVVRRRGAAGAGVVGAGAGGAAVAGAAAVGVGAEGGPQVDEAVPVGGVGSGAAEVAGRGEEPVDRLLRVRPRARSAASAPDDVRRRHRGAGLEGAAPVGEGGEDVPARLRRCRRRPGAATPQAADPIEVA